MSQRDVLHFFSWNNTSLQYFLRHFTLWIFYHYMFHWLLQIRSRTRQGSVSQVLAENLYHRPWLKEFGPLEMIDRLGCKRIAETYAHESRDGLNKAIQKLIKYIYTYQTWSTINPFKFLNRIRKYVRIRTSFREKRWVASLSIFMKILIFFKLSLFISWI